MINEILNQIINIHNIIVHGDTIRTMAIWSPVIQLVILFLILFHIYKNFLKGTSSEVFVKGIIMLVVIWIFGDLLDKFNILILGAFFKISSSIIAISLIVIFQPELRKFISYIGHSSFLLKLFYRKKETNYEKRVNILQELTETVKYLSKNKIGGLIVLQSNDNQTQLSEVGIKIDAAISSELLITMFFPNTPLHDGAVVVKGEKIVSAGVLLPLTEDPQLSWQYGTRHRAAIGVTEVHNCSCIVVSEETGNVSITYAGTLKKYESIADFKTDLKQVLKIEQEDTAKTEQNSIFNLTNLSNKK